MIDVETVLDGRGIVATVSAKGHSGTGAKGENVLCAAVSVLLRTAYETLASADGIAITGTAGRPGDFSFSVRSVDDEISSWARGVTDSLLTGLSSLDREYPGELTILLRKNWRN